MLRAVQFSTGVPPLSQFRSGGGSPLLVDLVTSIGYYSHPLTGAIVALSGGGGGGTGTVTHTAGGLTLGLVVVGNGAADLKTLAASTDGWVLTQAAGIASWAAPAAATLQFWAESQSTTAPNGSIAASRFIPVNASFTDIDAVISPKGNSGAILGQLPNNAISQGNKRGAHAVDFQLERDAATSVASGGQTFIGGGRDNSATAQYATVPGGNANTGSGSGSTVSGGINNLASGTNSWIPGGAQASTRGLSGKGAFAASTPSAPGDSQGGVMHLRRFTTDGTPSVITASGSAASAINIDVMPNASTYLFQVMVVAHKDSTASAGWIIEGLIARDTGVATTVIIGTNGVRSWGTNGGAPPAGWNCTVTADTTNGGLIVTATGAAATQISWTGVVRTSEAKG